MPQRAFAVAALLTATVVLTPTQAGELNTIEPTSRQRHVEDTASGRHQYAVTMRGMLDMENTITRGHGDIDIAFQPNIALTIENVSDTPVVNPRLVINDRGNWYTWQSMLREFTRGATTNQEKVYFIWQNMRENRYHESPLFGSTEPHDPVKMLNVYGLNLCGQVGNATCVLFQAAGFKKSYNRALHGHVQCEAFVNGAHQFMDVDQDCFYLDRENETPVSGDECARDHDLVRREYNYGPLASRWRDSDTVAALFGADDGEGWKPVRGHEIAYTLRPGEKVIFRWDNIGKYCAQNAERAHLPNFFGNSKFIFRPRLDLESVQAEAAAATDIGQASAPDRGGKLAGQSGYVELVYEIAPSYAVCGGTVRATFFGLSARDGFSIAVSFDAEKWTQVWEQAGAGRIEADVPLDEALDVHNEPAKYRYWVRIGLASAGAERGANLCSLEIETDVMAAPLSLPRLSLGENRVVYRDETDGPHRVRIIHEWQENDAAQPLAPPPAPEHPRPGAEVTDSIVTFSWPAAVGADRYHLQVSRRPDFKFPYRTSFDVIIPSTTWCVPHTGIFSPDTTYYWRLRSRNTQGVWGPWGKGWTFTWHGPRVPVTLHTKRKGRAITLRWEPNPRGTRPVRYEVYGSDEKGFSVHKEEHASFKRGQVPGNFVAETAQTSMVVVSPTADRPNMNKVYYRVVAIDANGTASGCSDYAEMPHPFVYSDPETSAKAETEYRYEAKSLHSLNDAQRDGRTGKTDFWDIEENKFTLVEGPAWLRMDEQTGALSGTPGPGDVGRVRVKIAVENQFGDRAEQGFEIIVTR